MCIAKRVTGHGVNSNGRKNGFGGRRYGGLRKMTVCGMIRTVSGVVCHCAGNRYDAAKKENGWKRSTRHMETIIQVKDVGKTFIGKENTVEAL